mmetsp:Transcript_41355/g.58200  ORF Transcript_41355/g.58200 Transcript_41355/m.58200 type:complete len:171 (+) Transcript_41355:554-1066(+)
MNLPQDHGPWRGGSEILIQHTITETTKPAKLDPISAESKSKRRRKNGSISEYPPSHGKNFPQTQPQVQPIPQFHQHPHWHIPPALPTHTVHPSRPSYSAHYPPHRSSYYPPFGGVSHDAHHAGYYPANPPSGFPNGSSVQQQNTGTAPQREQSPTIDGTRGNNKRVVKKP